MSLPPSYIYTAGLLCGEALKQSVRFWKDQETLSKRTRCWSGLG